MSALDQYEEEGVDDEVTGEADFASAQAARLRAEHEMERRDVREGRFTGRRARLPGALEGRVQQRSLHSPVDLKSAAAGQYRLRLADWFRLGSTCPDQDESVQDDFRKLSAEERGTTAGNMPEQAVAQQLQNLLHETSSC